MKDYLVFIAVGWIVLVAMFLIASPVLGWMLFMEVVMPPAWIAAISGIGAFSLAFALPCLVHDFVDRLLHPSR